MSVEQLPELFEPSLEIETADEKYHRRRWWILAVIGIAQLMVILDGTIVNIALPPPSTRCTSPTPTDNGSLPPTRSPSVVSCFWVDVFLTTSVGRML